MTNSKPKTPWWGDPIALATVVIAIATFLNVAVSIAIGYFTSEYTKVTKDIYKSINRPYVGITGSEVKKENGKIYITVQYKNAGNVPATNTVIESNYLLEGYKMTDNAIKIQNAHGNMLPQGMLQGLTKVSSNYIDITSGSKVLDVEFIIKYNGINKDQYEDYEKYRYDNEHNVLVPVESRIK